MFAGRPVMPGRTEAVKPGVISIPQPSQQAVSSTSTTMSTAFPQHLPAHPFSLPAIHAGHFANMTDYPLPSPNFPYMPSAYQQAYLGLKKNVEDNVGGRRGSARVKELTWLKPVKGDALLVFNLRPNATPDESSIDGGCKVLEGVKWIATKRIHARAYSLSKSPPSDSDDECTDEDNNCAN